MRRLCEAHGGAETRLVLTLAVFCLSALLAGAGISGELTQAVIVVGGASVLLLVFAARIASQRRDAMRLCPHCGNQTPSDRFGCERCGGSLWTRESERIDQPPLTASQAASTAGETSSISTRVPAREKRFLIIFFAAAGLIAMLLVGWDSIRPSVRTTGSLSTETILLGAPAPRLTLSVSNTGLLSSSVPIQAYVDGEPLGEPQWIRVRGRETRKVVVDSPRDLADGSHVYDWLDPNGDRAQGVTLEVRSPANVTISSISVTPEAVNVGGRVRALATLSNSGDEVGERTIAATLDGKLIFRQTIAVSGNASRNVEFDVASNRPGVHTVACGDAGRVKYRVRDIRRLKNATAILNHTRGGYGRLIVQNRLDRDAVFVLATSGKKPLPVLAVYVRSNSTAKVGSIRSGTYQAYWTSGSSWDTHAREFTQGRALMKSPRPVVYASSTTRRAVYYDVLTFTLFTYPILAWDGNGNPIRSPTSEVTTSQFPHIGD